MLTIEKPLLQTHPALLAAVLLASGAGRPAEASPPSAPRSQALVDVFVSAGDNWWLGSWLPLDSPASIRDSVQMWADVFQAQRIYWRGFQDELVLDHHLIRPENFLYYDYWQWSRHLVKEVGVNRRLIQQAHRRRMEVFMWAPLFDYCGPADTGGCADYPYQSQWKLTLEHPEWRPVDRHGFRQQNGPVALCYPETRQALIDLYLRYLREDHYDGLTFFTYAENFGLRYEDEFGFNPPAVEEFRRRYGVDVRTQDYDKHLWRYLLGEYVTQFLRELRAAVQPYGKKIGVVLNPREPHFPQPWNVTPYTITAGRIYLDWERWVREGLVDELHVYGACPPELQHRTIENCLAAVKGTRTTVECLSSSPYDDRFKPYQAQGLRMSLFATDEAYYLNVGYPAQPAEALHGPDPYAAMRVLAQVIAGETKVTADQIIPLTQHKNVLMRRIALAALAALKDPQALPALEAALEDPESSVRAAAATALASVNGPETVPRLIAAVRRFPHFQLFQAVCSTLVAIDPQYLPQIMEVAHDPDARVRLLVISVLGSRALPEAVPILLAGLQEEDPYWRWKSARSLASFGARSEVVEALLGALKDPVAAVQDRAAVSLGNAVGSRRDPDFAATRQRVIEALVDLFQQFGDGCTRSDADWGFRPVGNALLAFGEEGTAPLRALMNQKQDRRLADLAWQVLHVRQAVMEFCPLKRGEEEAAEVYHLRPHVNAP